MTCNPSWQEITESLGVKPSGTPINASTRPDLVARVFYLKPKRLIADIKGTASAPGCSGKLKNFVYTIGYQKCGLPHMHMLTTLDEQSKLKTAENIDKGYPLCRRRQDGREFVYGSGQSPRRADNRWIVPYCPALLKKYSCHMNVEIVQGLHAVKYLYKYIFKRDEISQHLDARYVRSSEAYARLLRKPIRGRTHAFIRLHVHKPGQMPTEQEVVDTDDPVVGEPELDEEAVGEADDNLVQVDAVAPEDNNHTVQAQPVIGNGLAGSNRNDALPVSDDEGDDDAERNDDNDGRHLTYVDFCIHFRFDKNKGKWFKRAREVNVIGRMFNASPRDQEVYNLRLLLFYVKGATCFKDIRTVDENGVTTVHTTFTAAALARGLIEDDDEHIKTME
ncbi:hypothetical protein AAVH_14868 [Aphelenchoides avenae]|nr:hypothetical protein AAVH_14868 [Aphelenchus avenae]